MIVALTNHLKNAVNGSRLLSSSAIATPVFKRFGSSLEYNEVLKMAKETEDKEYEQLKKYRQAEVSQKEIVIKLKPIINIGFIENYS